MESNFNLTKKNAEIMSRKFWESYSKIMELDSLSIGDKLNLVELKKEMLNELDTIQEALKGMKQEDANDLMFKEYKTQFSVVTAPLDKFSAEDLYQLKGIINMENNNE